MVFLVFCKEIDEVEVLSGEMKFVDVSMRKEPRNKRHYSAAQTPHFAVVKLTLRANEEGWTNGQGLSNLPTDKHNFT